MSSAAPELADPYESRAAIPIAVVTTGLAVSFIAVSLRTYCRAILIRQFGYDDWAAILALIFAIGSGSMVCANTLYGQGKHLAVVDMTQLWKYFRGFYVSIVLYNASLTFIKATFLLQYYRILGTGKMRRIITYASVFVGLWAISQLLVATFNCSPIPKFWLPELPGTCIPNLPFWHINAAGNIITDVIIFILPLPALGKLNLRRGQKYALIGVFCLGFFTCAISVIRIQYLKLSPDVTWDNVPSSCWSITELCCGIVCACLPTLRPLITGCLPGMRSQGGKSSDNKYYNMKRSSGRELSNGSRLKSTDENASSRGIIYPEDLELQSDDRSDKDIRGAGAPAPAGGLSAPSAVFKKDTRAGLGLQPTVRTEIAVGTPGAGSSSWPPPSERGIEIKRDFVMTSGKYTA